MLNFVFLPRQTLHGVTRPPSIMTNVVKKRKRNDGDLSARSGNLVLSSIATGTARGIIITKRHDSDQCRKSPSADATFTHSGGLGSPIESGSGVWAAL